MIWVTLFSSCATRLSSQAGYLKESPRFKNHNICLVYLNEGGYPHLWYEDLMTINFDTFLFLATSIKKHGLWPYPSGQKGLTLIYSNKNDWQHYIKTLQKNLQRLNFACKSNKNIIVAIPYPDPRQHNFYETKPPSGNFSEQDNIDRLAACRQFIDQIVTLPWKSLYPSLSLSGFYWISETINNWGNQGEWSTGSRERRRYIHDKVEASLIREIAKYIHSHAFKGEQLEFYWIPGSGQKQPFYIEYNPDPYTDFGFDVVILQPGIERYANNYFSIAHHCFIYKLGIHIECISGLAKGPAAQGTWVRTFTEELDAGSLFGYQNNCVNSYYFQRDKEHNLVALSNSNTGWKNAIFEKVRRFVDGTYDRLGYYCDVGNNNDYDNDGRLDDADVDLHSPGVCIYNNKEWSYSGTTGGISWRKANNAGANIQLNNPYPDKNYVIVIKYKTQYTDGKFQQFTSTGYQILGPLHESNDWKTHIYVTSKDYYDHKDYGNQFLNILFEFTVPIIVADIWTFPLPLGPNIYEAGMKNPLYFTAVGQVGADDDINAHTPGLSIKKNDNWETPRLWVDEYEQTKFGRRTLAKNAHFYLNEPDTDKDFIIGITYLSVTNNDIKVRQYEDEIYRECGILPNSHKWNTVYIRIDQDYFMDFEENGYLNIKFDFTEPIIVSELFGYIQHETQ